MTTCGLASKRHARTGIETPETNEAAANTGAIPQGCVVLPLELWRRVALYMSSRDLARGLNQVSKAFRPLGLDAICLCLTDGDECCHRLVTWQTRSLRTTLEVMEIWTDMAQAQPCSACV
ncbi:g2643 [Coccomyxa viridis]|uniref:G2643 protein n=1 Tax=Coccomyxa viridis TaxID=1274662 RepID=A0ABP1FSZ2_9CHLO